jgi:hypothetical protein
MADVTVTAANVELVDGNTGVLTAGATITAGQAIYKDTSDSNKAKLADADAGTTLAATVEGIALSGATSGNKVTFAKLGAEVDIGGTVSMGRVYVLSGTAGAIAPEADLATSDRCSVIGYATSATNLKLTLNNTDVTLP